MVAYLSFECRVKTIYHLLHVIIFNAIVYFYLILSYASWIAGGSLVIDAVG
mgnify:CR=1 FL=1